jgi:hypothetical protein
VAGGLGLGHHAPAAAPVAAAEPVAA